MREPTERDLMDFLCACNVLRNLTERGFQLYLANDTMCLMRGDSHDRYGRAQRDNAIDSVAIPGASGGDW